MAKLESEFAFTGRLGDYVAYRLPGVDGIVMRRKGGVSAKRIHTDANFINTRNVNAEFSGRSAACKWIMQMIYPLKAVADYNIAGPLNALLRPIQKLDNQSKNGERNVCLTKDPSLLSGFSFNRKLSLDAILRCPIDYTLSKEKRNATVTIPALRPGINLHVPQRYPLFMITVVLGVVPDLLYSSPDYRPSHESYALLRPVSASTTWFSSKDGSALIDLSLVLSSVIPDDNFSLVLSIGVQFGVPTSGGLGVQIARSGAGKILAVR